MPLGRILVVWIMCISAVSCGNGEQSFIASFEPTLDTNGKVYVLSMPTKDRSVKLLLFDEELNKLGEIYNKNSLSMDGHFAGKYFYYVKYDKERMYSHIIRCRKFDVACVEVFSRSGSIRHPFEISDSVLIFLASEYDTRTFDESGYASYKFFQYDFVKKNITELSRDQFALMGPSIKYHNRIHFGALFSDVSDEPVIANDDIRYRYDYIFDIATNKIDKDDRKNDIRGNFYIDILVSGSDGRNLSYVGVPVGGKYRFFSCVFNTNPEKECDKKNRTTHPVYYSGYFYYAILNDDGSPAAIEKLEWN